MIYGRITLWVELADKGTEECLSDVTETPNSHKSRSCAVQFRGNKNRFSAKLLLLCVNMAPFCVDSVVNRPQNSAHSVTPTNLKQVKTNHPHSTFLGIFVTVSIQSVLVVWHALLKDLIQSTCSVNCITFLCEIHTFSFPLSFVCNLEERMQVYLKVNLST